MRRVQHQGGWRVRNRMAHVPFLVFVESVRGPLREWGLGV